MNLAVIPARGGSKRIPKKNVKLFAGKPLIAYSIEAAIASGEFDKIIVSTDSEQIAEVAIEYGAEVPFLRPAELSGDYVGTGPVTKHAIEYCEQHFFSPEFVCCIYATAPFVQVEYLQQGLTSLQKQKDKEFAFSVTSFPFPIQRALKVSNTGITAMYPEHIAKRSQDLEEAYHDAGQFYWGHKNAHLEGKPMFSEHSIPIILPRHLVQDIDTSEDWFRAELMYRAYVQGTKSD